MPRAKATGTRTTIRTAKMENMSHPTSADVIAAPPDGVQDGDRGADHDDPDEEKSRGFLGPDVARDELRVPGHDLQRDGDDQEGEQSGDENLQEPEVRVDDALHFTALMAARTFSASISLANASFTGAASSRSLTRSAKGWIRILPSAFSFSRI